MGNGNGNRSVGHELHCTALSVKSDRARGDHTVIRRVRSEGTRDSRARGSITRGPVASRVRHALSKTHTLTLTLTLTHTHTHTLGTRKRKRTCTRRRARAALSKAQAEVKWNRKPSSSEHALSLIGNQGDATWDVRQGLWLWLWLWKATREGSSGACTGAG